MKKQKKITKAKLRKLERRKAKKEFKAKLQAWKYKIIDRDKFKCQKCNNLLLLSNKHVHHIISLQAVKRKYPELLEDINNGVLLCGYCHKFAPDSAHQGSFEFVNWLKVNKPVQYEYLLNKVGEANET
jgi:5-methylcytosine-specific restriction endonuclease McrA